MYERELLKLLVVEDIVNVINNVYELLRLRELTLPHVLSGQKSTYQSNDKSLSSMIMKPIMAFEFK